MARACSSVSSPAFFQAASLRSIPTEHLPRAGKEDATVEAAEKEKDLLDALGRFFVKPSGWGVI